MLGVLFGNCLDEKPSEQEVVGEEELLHGIGHSNTSGGKHEWIKRDEQGGDESENKTLYHFCIGEKEDDRAEGEKE